MINPKMKENLANYPNYSIMDFWTLVMTEIK